ncbi:DUF4365 domain-containing protein [Ralstonia pseudosolanacearum]|uniref:DUF4365 domain-containing protein n=1 Tax=Ralstonia solanacearum TaxID=305 RepID=A0A0S4TZY4_RALSL|nr:hypothetical protein RSP799_23070 [Ralstonia solanacearum]CUV15570.1 conserved protein of unknown function [Ralstonia solanacearum]
MKLPERIRQHKAESDSYAILQYKLRGLGIFRNVTESDYGIDFEVEIVSGNQVTGRYFKAQVKSSEKLRVRKSDKVPVVGGIKESTLYYWTELSFKTHVLLYAVNLKNEKIYVSAPIFWQATQLINGDDKKKSVAFKKEDPVLGDKTALLLSGVIALSPLLPDILYSHRLALRHLKQILSLYVDVFHYDGGGELHDPDAFKALLEVCKILLFGKDWSDTPLNEEEKKYLLTYEYWLRKSGQYADEVNNHAAQTPVKTLVPYLMQALAKLRERVFAGKYYWSNKDRSYLRLVYETVIPKDCSHEALSEWGYHYDAHQRQVAGFDYFLQRDLVELRQAGFMQ